MIAVRTKGLLVMAHVQHPLHGFIWSFWSVPLPSLDLNRLLIRSSEILNDPERSLLSLDLPHIGRTEREGRTGEKRNE